MLKKNPHQYMLNIVESRIQTIFHINEMNQYQKLSIFFNNRGVSFVQFKRCNKSMARFRNRPERTVIASRHFRLHKRSVDCLHVVGESCVKLAHCVRSTNCLRVIQILINRLGSHVDMLNTES